ncbi:hypothetical protein SNOG_05501 [Parastagonospora nodorum SN15]|uniref:Uncharacterized protein n=1 Tax=Phaeosphaeria nodorum (strain SN15 / ATCC MYA-4574 / FGSC 10173) TaxID=321614 RepID=Q0URW3_PHANO|nr:hypothetical protein SNOG_05501 [Parastagonospora nodorum SN15]EAT86565.1 hypothetical protein SNOG_05501 [Parastagonospora nodorum SN15]
MSNHTQNITQLPSNPQYYTATTNLTPQRLGDSRTELSGFNVSRSISNTDLMYVYAPESWNSITLTTSTNSKTHMKTSEISAAEMPPHSLEAIENMW